MTDAGVMIVRMDEPLVFGVAPGAVGSMTTGGVGVAPGSVGSATTVAAAELATAAGAILICMHSMEGRKDLEARMGGGSLE
jgi:purine-cytosine permease-like protein